MYRPVRVILLVLVTGMAVVCFAASDQANVNESSDDRPLLTSNSREAVFRYNSFDTLFAWEYDNVDSTDPGYIGAIGESFSPTVADSPVCFMMDWMSFWLTQDGDYVDQTMDLYVWQGGVFGEPQEVLWMAEGRRPTSVPNWPIVAENRFDVNYEFVGDITIGYWGAWPGSEAGFFSVIDLEPDPHLPGNGWTYAGGPGWPERWYTMEEIFYEPMPSPCSTMAMGEPSPVVEGTWGAIKSMFR
jgi:hypothetical protein